MNDTVERDNKYAAVYSRYFVQLAQMKSLFGKPHLKTGTMWMTAGFVFQTGTILGRHFRDHAVPFLAAFACDEGYEENTLTEGGKQVAATIVPHAAKVMNTAELVWMGVNKQEGLDFVQMIMRYGTTKVDLATAFELCFKSAAKGAVFGIQYPEMLVELYNRTHQPADPKEWKEAHDHGLDIPAVPDRVIPFDEQEEIDVEAFEGYIKMHYLNVMTALGIA